MVADGISAGLSLWPLSRIPSTRKQFWTAVLDRFILGLSDQQLVTGFSILIIGFVKIRHLSIYHFHLIISLAMFSCSAHLASVLSLRRYFQSRPMMAKLRFFVMITFAFALMVALLMAGGPFFYPMIDPRCPTICSIQNDYWANGAAIHKVSGIILCIVLMFCYWTALSHMLPNVILTKWMFTKPLEFLERMLRIYQFHERFMHRRPHIPTILLSQGAQLVWWVISFVLSVTQRFPRSNPVRGSENAWGFGQLLALFLITLPLLSAMEIFFGECKQEWKWDLKRLDLLKCHGSRGTNS